MLRYFTLSTGILFSLVAQSVTNLPALQETQVQSLGWEDPQRRKWQPTPVFLPEKFQGQRSLVGWKESDMTEATACVQVSDPSRIPHNLLCSVIIAMHLSHRLYPS